MSDIPLAHLTRHGFTVRDDVLWIGGKPLPQVVREAGGTPFYAYDRALLTERVKALRQALPPEIHLHYAIKANPMPAVVQHLAGLVDGLDVASAGELEIALATGMERRHISFAGPGKSERELRRAVKAGIVINMESETEMRRLVAIASASGIRPQVAIRVNPDFELKSSGMKMGGGGKQFGIDAERVPEVLNKLKGLPLDFVGFHIFCGSQNLRSEAIIEAQNNTIDLAMRLAAAAPRPPRLFNLGGGFGIPYFPGEQPLELAPIGANLAAKLPLLKTPYPGAEIVIELGRYLVGEAGIYVCEIVDRKVSRGQIFLITNGGLHQHLAASGNFGQVIRKNYPVVIGNRIRGEARETATVVGPLCTPLDTLAHQMDLARAEIGDYVVVLQSGAYGLTASPLNFLGHPNPKEFIL
jgi:diaminopimelate decarboxylase